MKTKPFTRHMILCAMFTACIAAGAFIKIPIPMIPFTLQFLFTTLAGILLGGKRGAISVFCYIILGLIGLPVFAEGGGIGYILKPSFGYIIGFCLGSLITGWIANRIPYPSFQRLLFANFAGLLIVYLLGMGYYWGISTIYLGTVISIRTLFLYCFLLAIPGDILLCILAAILGNRLIPALRKT